MQYRAQAISIGSGSNSDLIWAFNHASAWLAKCVLACDERKIFAVIGQARAGNEVPDIFGSVVGSCRGRCFFSFVVVYLIEVRMSLQGVYFSYECR
jgi:hypothetical protein